MSDEQLYRISDLYYDIIIGKESNEDLFRSLIERAKQEGYSFQPLYNGLITDLYQKLLHVKAEKLKAVNDKQYQHAFDLKNEENLLLKELDEIAYFTTGKNKTITFVCIRKELDEWILKP